MDTADFTIKQNDTAPRIEGTLTDGNGDAVDVTGATVKLHLHGLTVEQDMINLSGAVADGPAGKVFYNWQAADTDVAGWYSGEFQVTLTTGKILSFPNDGTFLVHIAEQVG